MNSNRLGFASKVGGLLAAAGSAVGLGNIWRFPTQAGQNGGAAFLIVYLAIILIFGIPMLITEFSIGRHARANVGNAYSVLAPNTNWKWIGTASVMVAFVIFCYYNVVVGWVFYYLFDAVTGTFVQLGNVLTDDNSNAFKNHFGQFVSDPLKPIICLFIVTAIIHFVIVCGVQKGIERSAKILMPALFIIMLMLVGFALTMPGAAQGIEFLFKPNFAAINADVVLSALGQCFYSFSLGLGLITYASYFRRDVNLNRTALSVASIDTAIAIMAGLIIFPAVFSVAGMSPSDGAGLVFISLPNVFNSALQSVPFLNWLVPSAFYLILLFAALTSTIFLHEVATAYIAERTTLSRKRAATVVSVSAFLIGCIASLSMGPLEFIKIFGMNIFDFLDYVTAKLILPLTGLGAALFVGWKMTPKQLLTELTSFGTVKFMWLAPFMILVRYVIPVLILIIMITQLFGIKFSA
ncbi:MAG: sodium-dependent transporter [Succinivibrio sp.]